MARSVRALAAIALLAAGCSSGDATSKGGPTTSEPPTSAPVTEETPTTAAFDADPVDWGDRSAVDISLPSGWRLTGCEGDAPFLCASGADGEVDGTIALLEYPDPEGSNAREDVRADAEELYRTIEEDRRLTCGPGVTLEPDPITSVTVGGEPGHRYGYELRDAGGRTTERVVLHVTEVGSSLIVFNTAFSDPAGCPGEDPERNEFPVDAFAEIEPYLDELVAESVLPSGP